MNARHINGRIDFGAVVDNAADATEMEQLGYGFIGRGDDLAAFTGLLELARATATSQIGSFILTAYGRHPAVTAIEATRIQQVSGGRLVMTAGRGFRSAALMGRPPIPLDETRDYVSAVRSLLRGESAAWEGHVVPALTGTAHVPIFVSAYGPAVRRLAGAVGDGVVIAAGADLGQLRSFIADVAGGAAAAGRSMDAVEVWMLCRASVRSDRSEALADVRGLIAAAAYRHLQARSQVETVPADRRDALVEFRRRYDPQGFEGYQPSWNGPNARLVTELGLDEYLAGRFAIVGTPDECREQVAALEAEGVSRIVFAPGGRDGETLYRRLADALIRPAR